MILRPMLAADLFDKDGDLRLDWIRYPVLATPKVDGIRCVVQDGQVLSRTFKKIPNKFISSMLEQTWHNLMLDDELEDLVLDGELVTFSDKNLDSFNQIQSKVMSEDGEPEFLFMVFDAFCGKLPGRYDTRIENLYRLTCEEFLNPLFPVVLSTETELLDYEEQMLADGWEGLCFRTPNSPYKQGRSTVKEGYLIKLKRYEISTAEVLDYEERLHNTNQLEQDNFGLAKRSHKISGMVGRDTLGSLLVRDLGSGVTFSIDFRSTDSGRKQAWLDKDNLKGRRLRYKFFPRGVKEAPRHPVFLEWLP